ncbi:MAG: alpha/beta hydrolase [Stappia sp.]|uniref:alpha/beta family hydrolase n=1 Tax=Stappia sp. TaxID=1870903 RepID=UPI000C3C943C|nr:alpha/beta family hydrolase [Stappia sp.]MAA97897.1 alpha/beta hydrolase [Stappia sp.]MBM19689.1 alpha/beta hydrolase [Stappia sp.]
MTDFLWTRPDGEAPAVATLLLAHGAGAAMDSGFMNRFAGHAAAAGLDVARFEFAYMAGRRAGGPKRPPPKAELLVGEFQKALQQVLGETSGPVLIGGKSMGGRVAAMLAASSSLPRRVTGVACLGYPFHPQGRTDTWRLAPLEASRRPVLIAQGERDAFGNAAELEDVMLPDQARLVWLEDGSHDLAPRGASPATWEGNLTRTAQAVADFAHETGETA